MYIKYSRNSRTVGYDSATVFSRTTSFSSAFPSQVMSFPFFSYNPRTDFAYAAFPFFTARLIAVASGQEVVYSDVIATASSAEGVSAPSS